MRWPCEACDASGAYPLPSAWLAAWQETVSIWTFGSPDRDETEALAKAFGDDADKDGEDKIRRSTQFSYCYGTGEDGEMPDETKIRIEIEHELLPDVVAKAGGISPRMIFEAKVKRAVERDPEAGGAPLMIAKDWYYRSGLWELMFKLQKPASTSATKRARSPPRRKDRK